MLLSLTTVAFSVVIIGVLVLYHPVIDAGNQLIMVISILLDYALFAFF
jgi:hypothetical protein